MSDDNLLATIDRLLRDKILEDRETMENGVRNLGLTKEDIQEVMALWKKWLRGL